MKKIQKALVSLVALLMLVGVTGCQKKDAQNQKTGVVVEHRELKEYEKHLAPEERLTKTYITRYGADNSANYPVFKFDFPDRWKVTEETVDSSTGSIVSEKVRLESDTGAVIEFVHLSLPRQVDFNANATGLARVKVEKVAQSRFKPDVWKDQDYRSLGPFMVAELKTTAIMDLQRDSDFHDVDGSIRYALLPETFYETTQTATIDSDSFFSFWYGAHISFVAHSPNEKMSALDEDNVLQILGSFRLRDAKEEV